MSSHVSNVLRGACLNELHQEKSELAKTLESCFGLKTQSSGLVVMASQLRFECKYESPLSVTTKRIQMKFF